MGYGFREIIIDQPFSGKWTEVDMNIGGGHGTFQGAKFSDYAGGFSYRNSSSQKHIVRNRFIYWRVLNDMLELTECSMDHNLEDNQVRILFRDSPIVSPVCIVEADANVVILVVTVTSVNRFVFTHPNKLFTEDQKSMKNTKQPSIFQQALIKPLMNFSSFSLFEHAINIPVPTTAASHIMPYHTGYIFALSYESGGVTICKITKDDTLCLYDLRQANIFARLLSYTPSILRYGSTSSPDAVVGISFFTAKLQHNKKNLFLVTLSMNGHLRLYICNNLHTIDSWTILVDILVDKRFAMAGHTDSTMVLRKCHENKNEYPKFVVFVPSEGFKIFQCLRDETGHALTKLVLNETNSINFKEKSVMDFCVTSEFLFTLVNNPDEETDWEVKSYDLNEQLHPGFNLALLEPPPQHDVYNSTSTEPKEFYSNLIFNKSSFSVSTIYSALSMLRNSDSFSKAECDWELTKFYALRVIESEIRSITAESDEPVGDDDVYELNLKYWGEFYTSCVEYHIGTVKPLGIFYETNSKVVCIVKKSRISFLRPTDFLETALYFPHFIPVPDSEEAASHTTTLLKYLEIMDNIESTLDEPHKYKIEKRIRGNKQNSMEIWDELANLIIEADPHSEVLERRHFVGMLTNKLRGLGVHGTVIMKNVIQILSTWDSENEVQVAHTSMDTTSSDDTERGSVSQFFMGSRLGANITYRILMQLLSHRYMIGRNTLILQAIVSKFASERGDQEGVHILTSFNDQRTAQLTLLRCFSLLDLCDRPGEFVHDNWSENGLKVANLINCRALDQLVIGKIPEFWPIKLVELFCNSVTGGLAIRSRVNHLKPSMVLDYADAAGRALWCNEDSPEHPFEDFLIGACQYNALAFYATTLQQYRQMDTERSVLRIFYSGVSDFFLRSPQAALSRLISIPHQNLRDAPYFCTKILGIQDQSQYLPNIFFEKIVNLFQIFGYTYGVQRLAEEALGICRDDRWVRIMSVLGFKSALTLRDYESAFQFILCMQKQSIGPSGQLLLGKERESSIRTFVTKVLENRDIDVLVGLKTEAFSDTIRDEIEKVLHAQAKLSDPLAEDSVYQMVYFYHLCRRNFEKAAMIMLERVTQVGIKGKGRGALEIQRDAYLDILSCISLTNEDTAKKIQIGSGDNSNVDDWLIVLQNTKISVTPESMPVEDHFGIMERVKSYEKIRRECELCISLLLLQDEQEVDPVKYFHERERAEACVSNLVSIHHYDQAIKVAQMWEISYLPVISTFTKTCVNLVYNIKPASGDPADYVRHLELSELPNSNASVPDLAFLLLKKYISTLEKPKESKLHQEATTVLLQHSINLPRWLLESYKKRDVNQLILCFMRYGDWEEAADLSLEVLDVALGRRDSKEFDPSVQVVTPFLHLPIIPYNTIEDLANQMNQYTKSQPKLVDVIQTLRERCDDFVLRVLETRQERRLMFTA